MTDAVEMHDEDASGSATIKGAFSTNFAHGLEAGASFSATFGGGSIVGPWAWQADADQTQSSLRDR